MVGRAEREAYIPIRKQELVELLCRQKELSPGDREPFQRLCRLLDAMLHFEYHSRLESLKNAYACFDPDADTQPLQPVTVDERSLRLETFFEDFVALLERANFTRLSRDDLNAVLAVASDWGMNLAVDFDVFERLEIFARGDVVGQRSRRRWRNSLRLESVDVPIYQRLVVILRLREGKSLGKGVDTDSVYIKIFKDIPKVDLEMLLPGTRVKLSLFDQGRILLPTLSGVALSVWKIVQGAMTIALSGLYGSLAFLGLLGGTFGYGMRSFVGYLRTKQKYQLNLTQSLYYQNLDNNAGALFRLLNDAEEQEFREVILAYYFLAFRGGDARWSTRDLDAQIELFLQQFVEVPVDFEINDAVVKLIRYQVAELAPDGTLRAVPLAECLKRLDQTWDNAFQYNVSRVPEPSGLFRAAASPVPVERRN